MDQYRGYRGFGRFSMFPPVLKSLLIINIAVYAFQFLFLRFYSINGINLNDWFMHYFALQPFGDLYSASSFGNFYPWQLISYQFMHQGFLHIAFNMFALWMFGAELENLWGSRRFLFYYLLCGIGAGLFQLFVSPIFAPPAATIGASGAIYGILLAFGLTFPDRPIFMFPLFIPIPAKIFVIIFAGIELLTGFTSADGVAHFAHLGGAFTGLLLIKFGDKVGIFRLIDKFFRPKSNYSSTYHTYPEEKKVYRVNWQTPPDPYQKPRERSSTSASSFNIDGEEITQSKIDEILDKISESGYQNLSEREKKILFELSQKLK